MTLPGINTGFVLEAVQGVFGFKYAQSLTPSPPGSKAPDPLDVRVSPAEEGALVWRFLGRRWRGTATIMYAAKTEVEKDTKSAGGGKGGGGSTTVYSYATTFAFGIGQSFGGTDGNGKVSLVFKVLGNQKEIYNSQSPKSGADRYEDVHLHEGGQAQLVDSIISALKSPTPAFRGLAYGAFELLQHGDFGGFPAQVEFIVQPDDHSGGSPYLVKQGLLDLWSRHPDRTSAEIDVTLVDGHAGVRTGDADEIDANGQVEGLGMEGPISLKDPIEALMMAYDLVAFDNKGVFTVMDRDDMPVVEVLAEHLGDTTSRKANGAERPVRVERDAEVRLPKSVTVEFRSRKNGYLKDAVKHRTAYDPAVVGENDVTIRLPMILPPVSARRLAKRYAYKPLREIERAFVSLPPRYAKVSPATVLAVPFTEEGDVLYVEVEKRTRGADYRYLFEGPIVTRRTIGDDILTSIPAEWSGDLEIDPSDAEDDASEADDIEGTNIDGYEVPDIVAVAANAPPAEDDEALFVGWKHAHAAYDPDQDWKGAKLYKAKKETGNYNKQDVATFGDESPIGVLIEAAAAAGSDGKYASPQDSIYVHMLEGALESVASPGLLYLLVGDEVIGARTVTAMTPVVFSGSATVNGTTPVQITRSTGSWVTDGFKANHFVRMSGWTTGSNDVFRLVTGVSSTLLTLAGEALDAEGPVAVTVTQDGAGAYQVGPFLLRGVRDTDDHAAGGHVAGSKVIVFSPGAYNLLKGNQSKIGKTFWFKSVPKGETLGGATAYSSDLDAEHCRPFRPCHLHFLPGADIFEDTGYEDRRIRWVHATRLIDDLDADVIHPLLEKKEKYQVQITATADEFGNPDFSSAVRLQTVKFTEHDTNRVCEWVYTSTMQTNDGLTPGDGIWVRIRQVGDLVAAGNWSETLEIPDSSSYYPPTGGLAALTSEVGA